MSERRRLYLSLFVIFVWGACSGGGCSCSCVAPIPGGFPYSEKIENATQVRLSSSGVEFIEDNVAEIAGAFVGSLSFPVPETDLSGMGTLCGGGATCTITITINSLNLDPTAPNILRINPLNVDVNSNSMPLDVLGLDCTAIIDAPGTELYADLVFTIDAGSDRAHVAIDPDSVTIANFDAGDIDISGGFLGACVLVDGLVTALWSFFEGMLIDQLTGPIEDAMDALCMPCDAGEPCPQLSSCDGSVCMESAGGTCVQSFGMEGRIDLTSALWQFSPGLYAAMDILAWLGGYATAVNDGMTLGMLGGALPDAHDPCVPVVDPPTGTIPQSTVLTGNSLDLGDGDFYDFDVGIGVHKLNLDTSGWAAFDAGALCLAISSANPDFGTFLSSSTIGVFIDLTHLVHEEEALPMVLALRPQNPPEFEIGEGTISYDDEGTPIIDDPLLTINLPRLGIDFYALVDQRYVRLMRIYADLVLPLALDTDEMGNIVPLMGDLTDAFTNLEAEGTELLTETPEEIAKTFPSLFMLVAGFLGDVIPPFALPDMQGFVLVDPIFRGVEDNTLMGIFTQLDFTPPTPLVRPVETTVSVTAVKTPATEEFRAGTARPAIEVEVESDRPAGTPTEWSYRIDGGLWSLYRRGARATLEHLMLLLHGRHTLYVRAREIGAPRTLDPTPAEVEFVIDSVPPDLDVSLEGGKFRLAGTDNVTAPANLEFAFAQGGADPAAWARGGLVAPRPEFEDVTAYVRDEAGNVTRREFHGSVPPPPSSGCTCRLSRGESGGARATGLLAIGLWLALGRRRS